MKELKKLFSSLYNDSEFAKSNLSKKETLTYLLESEGIEIKPFFDTELEEERRVKILDRAKRVFAGYPLQYETGFAYFYRSRFFVEEGVLIPRRDSEVLVEKAVELLPKNSHFLDLCTGTGCLGLSILAERPDTSATLVDISPTALSLSRKNAEALGLSDRCEILSFDVLNDSFSLLPSHSAVIMNPPYLTSGEMSEIPDNVSHEPTLALFGGDDGLEFYRRLHSQKGKLARLVIFEIGEKQAKALLSLYGEGEIVRDYTHHDRLFIRK